MLIYPASIVREFISIKNSQSKMTVRQALTYTCVFIFGVTVVLLLEVALGLYLYKVVKNDFEVVYANELRKGLCKSEFKQILDESSYVDKKIEAAMCKLGLCDRLELARERRHTGGRGGEHHHHHYGHVYGQGFRHHHHHPDPPPAGPPGPPGLPGTPGAQGIKGECGVPGLRGVQGDKGDMGFPGIKGERGLPGKEGQKGNIGAKGDKGDNGAQGKDGKAGAPGERGVPGQGGKPGLNGEKGESGIPGVPGVKGERGLPGERGVQGEKGNSGSTGAKGEQGLPGKEGHKGEIGIKGDKGEIGKTGGIGQDGKAGVPGEVGRPGLKGEKGDRGDVGNNGNPGIPGFNGPIGPPGKEGPEGKRGPKGDKGEPGLKGNKGDKCLRKYYSGKHDKFVISHNEDEITYQIDPRMGDCEWGSIGKMEPPITLNGSYSNFMIESNPTNDKEFKMIWATISDVPKLYEFDSITSLTKNEPSVVYDLDIPFDGNAHVIYNGCLFYYANGNKPDIVKYNFKTRSTQVFTIPNMALEMKPLYLSQSNKLDFSVDQNGLWAIFSNTKSDYVSTIKINHDVMTIENTWEVNIQSQNFIDMFFANGKLYTMQFTPSFDVEISLVINLFAGTVREVKMLGIRKTTEITMATYDPLREKMLLFDGGKMILYPFSCDISPTLVNPE